MPMRICLGTASNRVSFSNSTSQPSFALAKVTGLTTTLLSGRQTQPEQDWLPTSIPQIYLMGASSCEEPDVVWLMFHLLVLAEPSLCGLSTLMRERETRPTRASVSSSWIGNLAWRLVSANRWLLQQAS